MRVIWDLQPVTVRTIHERISRQKPVGYTTILKQVQRMHEEKGVLVRDISYGVHRYSCPLSEKEVKQHLTQKFMQTVFPDATEELLELIGVSAAVLPADTLALATVSMDDLRELMAYRAGI